MPTTCHLCGSSSAPSLVQNVICAARVVLQVWYTVRTWAHELDRLLTVSNIGLSKSLNVQEQRVL